MKTLLFASSLALLNPLQTHIDHHTVAGVVTLAASRERVLSSGAVGYADIAAGKPMTTDAVFWIASMSKPIAATAVMMLVEEGKINLDDPVEKYLPAFKGMKVAVERDNAHVLLRPAAHPITVRNLLSHTSGLTARTPLEQHIDALSLADNVDSYPMLPLRFEPGSRYEYSNAGINTAGRIVELVTGLDYADFLQRRLFTPLGMRETTFWPTPAQLTRLAKSYLPNADKTALVEIPIDQLSYPLDRRTRGACPAGGLFSTAADIACFGRMILGQGVYGGRRYLTAAGVREMTSTQTGDLAVEGLDHNGYGFGWSTVRKVADSHGVLRLGSFGHGGAYGTHLWIFPADDRITVFMIQYGSSTDGVRERVRGDWQKTVIPAL